LQLPEVLKWASHWLEIQAPIFVRHPSILQDETAQESITWDKNQSI